jgi:membrane-associated phospholipid phosphatase
MAKVDGLMNSSEIISGIASNWRKKVIFGLGLMALFALLYLLPQRCPMFPVTMMPPTWLDRAVLFSPDFVYLYESLYLLMPIAPWLMKSEEELDRYCLGIALMTFVGFCFFLLLPTSCSRPENALGANVLYRGLILVDNESNAFPSLHVAFALFHGACCHMIFCRGRGHAALRQFFWSWAIAISASTLLVKQHVFMDVVGGAILGLGIFMVCMQPKAIPWNSPRGLKAGS